VRRGIALFERIRYLFIWTFDIIELNGDDLRREPLERAMSLYFHHRIQRCLGSPGRSDQGNKRAAPASER
jgi:hypothetical protein